MYTRCLTGCMTLALTLLFNSTYAQHWYRIYQSFFQMELAANVSQTADGGFLLSGERYALKTDPNGQQQWRYNYPLQQAQGRQHLVTPDNGYILGYGGTLGDIRFIKLDMNGDTVWTRNHVFPGTFNHRVQDMILMPDSGWIAVGALMVGADMKILSMRLDKNGQLLWHKRYSYSGSSNSYAIRSATNGYLILVDDGFSAPVLLNVDANGDSVTTKPLAGMDTYGSPNIFQNTSDGGYISVTRGSNPVEIIVEKLDQSANQQWVQSYPHANRVAEAIIEVPGGGYVITGQIINMPDFELFITKIDNNGNVLWERIYSTDVITVGMDVINIGGGSLVISGASGPDNVTSSPLLMKVTDMGLLFTNVVNGNVYHDVNDNCVRNSGEDRKQSWAVSLTNQNNSYTTTTDSLGNYEFHVDAGNYTLQIHNASIYWDAASCSFNSTPVTLVADPNGIYDTTSVDFPRKALASCPVLDVDISTPLLRRCFQNVYYVNYCNHGTLDASNARIEVVLDSFLIPLSTSIPVDSVSVSGDTLYFAVGNLDVGDCGSFSITVLVSCDAVLGQNHCVSAHIFPDSLCLPPDPNWDLASVHVEANCIDNDSVQFRISNRGFGDMSAPANYYVTEENIMLFTNPFQLNSNTSITVTVAANGSTWRLEAEQSPFHPWNDAPVAVTVEGCGTNQQNGFTVGLFNDLPEYDYAPFYSLDCQPNIGSYDPNDKRPFPAGYDTPHYITKNDKLEYHIRFQNTGTDTAFTVVIRDTLSPYLNPASVISGASSHKYHFRIYDGRILEWTFSQIMLVDSNTNEPGSHGFVKFMVSQTPNNPNGTVIHNSAAIYFDYNEPVITNQTWNTIGENFIHFVSVESLNGPAFTIKAFPNPFSEFSTITVDGWNGEPLLLELYDLNGKQVQQLQSPSNLFTVHRNQIPSGLYMFRVYSGQQTIGTGKLIIQ